MMKLKSRKKIKATQKRNQRAKKKENSNSKRVVRKGNKDLRTNSTNPAVLNFIQKIIKQATTSTEEYRRLLTVKNPTSKTTANMFSKKD
mmetsp:Transcript_10710/g.9434  ORF Transcript_10710/g.9434 Transcript_10710/m.9434 type:complete len:89 (+) Transcript_10710:168-434(+)